MASFMEALRGEGGSSTFPDAGLYPKGISESAATDALGGVHGAAVGVGVYGSSSSAAL